MAQQENQFLIDSEFLSPQALEKKHRLETDPSSRKSHLNYLPGMEVLHSDVMEKVLSQMDSYDYTQYTARDVRAALEHDACSIEDFKALLSPAAEPLFGGDGPAGLPGDQKALWQHGVPVHPPVHCQLLRKLLCLLRL